MGAFGGFGCANGKSPNGQSPGDWTRNLRQAGPGASTSTVGGSHPGDAAALNKAAVDTIDLMGPTGSGAPYLGDFEAGWNGWTSIDITQPAISHWQVSDHNHAAAGTLAAWCGDLCFASCSGSLDVAGG